MTGKIGITIVGGTGYGAKELLRICEQHPLIEIVQVISINNADKKLSSFHPNLNKYSELKTSKDLDLLLLKGYSKRFIVLTLPHESSAEFISTRGSEINKQGIHIIDFSGCCRIVERNQREFHYPESKLVNETLIDSFQYGLPELYNSKICSAKNIANPGCYATAAILSLAPIAHLPLQNIVIDGKSGSSGAGKALSEKFHHPNLNASSFAYKIGTHRHQAEIKENSQINLSNFIFCPHVIPISRGMLVTTFVTLQNKTTIDEILKLYIASYSNSYFVKLCSKPPQINNVVGSNFCHIHLYCSENQIVIISVIDNLTKGMAGQAIQNINIMSGFAEHIGLTSPAMGLV